MKTTAWFLSAWALNAVGLGVLHDHYGAAFFDPWTIAVYLPIVVAGAIMWEIA